MCKLHSQSWINVCTTILLLLFLTPAASAFQKNDEATVQLNLGPDWKITRTQEKTNVAKVTEYTKHALTPNKEALLTTMLKKPASQKSTDPIVKKLYASTKKLMQKNGCSSEDIPNIPQNAGNENEWGIFWACARNNRTGFMFFIDGDPTTLYTLTYKADATYPLTPALRTNMITLLKSIQLCYKAKACAALIK